jgi:hypothetical protein
MELLLFITDELGNPYVWLPDFRYEISKTLQPGAELHLGPWKKAGWIRNAFILSNNPHVRINQTVFSAQRPLSYSFYDVHFTGICEPGPAGVVWVPLYDTVNNIYSMVYQPMPPQEFLPGADIWFSLPTIDSMGNPITTPATISYSICAILLDSKDKFLEKLREIFPITVEKLKLRKV